MHSFTFNGHNSEEFGIRIERFPDLNRSARKFKSASVSGRNGNIYQMEDAWEEVTVSYQIFAGDRENGEAVISFTDIMEWLHSADDYAELTDTYDPSHYRLAVYVDAIDIESEWHRFGKATIKFRCRPERYLVMSELAVENGDVINNPTNHIAKPIITLKGDGAHSLLDLEKPIFETNGGASRYFTTPYVLSDYMGFFYHDINQYTGKIDISTYSEAGASSNNCTLTTRDNATGTLTFTPKPTGNFIYGVGTAIDVLPNTDYTISCQTTSGASQIWVAFYSETKSNDISTTAEKDIDQAGLLTLTFRTPTDCLHIWIGFIRPEKTSGTFSNIMLTSGLSALPFQPYEAMSLEQLTVGDTTLEISMNGFDTAVVDCEREDFTVNGANGNMNTAIVDQYGNISVDYIQLEKGNNQISFSSGITSVTIEPRFWEL